MYNEIRVRFKGMAFRACAGTNYRKTKGGKFILNGVPEMNIRLMIGVQECGLVKELITGGFYRLGNMLFRYDGNCLCSAEDKHSEYLLFEMTEYLRLYYVGQPMVKEGGKGG